MKKRNIGAWCLVGVLAVAVVAIIIIAIKLNNKQLFWEHYPNGKKYNYTQQTATQSQFKEETRSIKDKNTALNFSLELPNCPATINEYVWEDEISSTVRIDKIVAEYSRDWDGTYDVTLNLTGEKIYGDEGYEIINYKLYDAENYIVENGILGVGKISAGDKFKNVEEHIYNLRPGTYRLEIYDYR